MASTAPRFLLADPSSGRTCVLLGLDGVDPTLDLDAPGSVAEHFGSDAFFAMDPDHPGDDEVADLLHTSDGYAVVSERAREVLAEAAPDAFEFLPVRIVRHDGDPVDAPYWIARPVEVIDAIDLDASDVEFHPADPDRISCVDELVLRAEAVGDRGAFRLRGFPRHVVVSGRVAEARAAANLSGLRLVPVDAFEF